MFIGANPHTMHPPISAGTERKHAITISSSQVSGTGTLTNFPVLITLDHLDVEVVDAGANSAQNGGGDLVFTSDLAGTTRLSCEIVNFVTSATPANRRCQIWVKVPSVSGSSDTTIYVWYKNAVRSQPAAGDAFGSQSVWTDYSFVTHDCVVDSSGNYTITQNSPASTVAYLDGNAADFNGSSNYHSINISAIEQPIEFRTFFLSYNIDVSEAAPRLLSANGGIGTDNMQVAQVNGVIVVGTQNSTSISTTNTKDSAVLSTGTWHRTSFTSGADYTSNSPLAYTNGIAMTANGTGGFSGGTVNNTLSIGAQQDNTDWFDGKIAQIFISPSVLSSDWLITDFNMINNPATFATAGAPTDDTF